LLTYERIFYLILVKNLLLETYVVGVQGKLLFGHFSLNLNRKESFYIFVKILLSVPRATRGTLGGG